MSDLFDAVAGLSEEFKERDGRLKHRKLGEKFGGAGPLSPRMWEPVFCYCGEPGGYVTIDTPIIYVCLTCTEKYGYLPLPMVPGTEHR